MTCSDNSHPPFFTFRPLRDLSSIQLKWRWGFPRFADARRIFPKKIETELIIVISRVHVWNSSDLKMRLLHHCIHEGKKTYDMIPERYREKRVFFSLRRVSHAILKKGFYLEVRLFYYSPFFFIFYFNFGPCATLAKSSCSVKCFSSGLTVSLKTANQSLAIKRKKWQILTVIREKS